ncbi:MAG: hypothetical protein LCH95_03045 [Proteobacteria bacterium]|nr:hypothetical protein [Pseudomonadota bacterium]
MEKPGHLSQADLEDAVQGSHRWLIGTTLGLVLCAFSLLLLGLLEWPSSEPTPFPTGERTLRDRSWVALGVAACALVAVALILSFIGFPTRSFRVSIKGQRWRLVAAFAVFAAATGTSGWLQVNSTLNAYRAARLEDQVAIARQKAAQIDDWTGERLGDLRFLVDALRGFPLVGADGKSEAVALADLLLAQFLSSYAERAAAGIFRPDGQPIALQGQFSPGLAEQLRTDIALTAKSNKPYIGVIGSGGVREAGLSLTFLAPLEKRDAPVADRLVVAIVVDPTVSLLKRFSEWPLGGKGVLSLGFRSGSDLVHIVDPGRQTGASVLSLRAPIREERLGRVPGDTRGEASWQGVGQGGQQTLTATYSLKDLPWIVMARTDLNEAMAPIARQIWALWVATAVVIAFGGLLMLTVASQMRLSRLIIEGQSQQQT